MLIERLSRVEIDGREVELIDPFQVVLEGVKRGAQVIFLGEAHDSVSARCFAIAALEEIRFCSRLSTLAIECPTEFQEELDVLNIEGRITNKLRIYLEGMMPANRDSDGYYGDVPVEANEKYIQFLEKAKQLGIPIMAIDERDRMQHTLYVQERNLDFNPFAEYPGELAMAAWIGTLVTRDRVVFVYCGDNHAEKHSLSMARIMESILGLGKVWSVIQLDGSFKNDFHRYGKFADIVEKTSHLSDRTFGFLDGRQFGIGADGIIYHSGDCKDIPVWEGPTAKRFREMDRKDRG